MAWGGGRGHDAYTDGMARELTTPPATDSRSDLLSVADYLRLEQHSDVRHEYVAGRRYAMVGASKRHAEIVLNCAFAVRSAARARRCRVWTSDVKLQVSADTIYYPDLIISCDARDRDAYLSNHPCVVVEVLSRTIASVDRRDKLMMYRGIESLRAYLMIHQDTPQVERHWRDASGAWQNTVVTEGVVPVPCVDVEIALMDLYADLPPSDDSE
jgi:Uma2 family endonuclease